MAAPVAKKNCNKTRLIPSSNALQSFNIEKDVIYPILSDLINTVVDQRAGPFERGLGSWGKIEKEKPST